MSSLITEDEISHEIELVWLEETTDLDYVRDRDTQPEGLYATGAPAEAVDPRTLAPATKGYKTERSEGGPPSTAMQERGITLLL